MSESVSLAPSLASKPRDPAADAAGALDRDMDALDAVLAQLVADRGLDAVIDAHRGERTGIATGGIGSITGQARDILRPLRDQRHVGFADADILGGDVASAERFDRIGEGGEHFGGLGRASSARITALPPPIGRPAMAFL